jgi:hypothetical protein
MTVTRSVALKSYLLAVVSGLAIFCGTDASLAEATKLNAEYIGSATRPDTNEFKELYINTIKNTEVKNTKYITYSTFSSTGKNESLSAIVYCDDKNPRFLRDDTGQEFKVDLPASGDLNSRVYNRVCERVAYKELPEPEADSSIENAVVSNGSKDMYNVIALDKNKNLTNLVKTIVKAGKHEIETFIYCDRDMSSIYYPRFNKLFDRNKIMMLYTSPENKQDKEDAVAYGLVIQNSCPNVDSYDWIIKERGLEHAVLRKRAKPQEVDTKPRSQFEKDLFNLINPFGAMEGTLEEKVRTIYVQYIVAKSACSTTPEGAYRLEELRQNMGPFEEWVKASGVSADKIWKDAVAASKNNPGLAIMGMGKMLPHQDQMLDECERISNQIEFQISKIAGSNSSSAKSLEKDF